MTTQQEKAQQARARYIGSRVRFTWPGASRSVGADLQDEISRTVDAEGGSIRTAKKLFNWKLDSLAALQSLRSEVRAYWIASTVSGWEEGQRLLPKAKVDDFEDRLAGFKAELAALAARVQADRVEIIDEARSRLGRAFQVNDYPPDLAALFDLAWGYPSLEVPEGLRTLSESAYAAEQSRQAMYLVGAMQIAEDGFVSQLADMVANLACKLAPDADGRKVKFRDAALENVQEFLARFSETILWGCDDIEEVVSEAREVLTGLSPEDLRRNRDLKTEVAQGLGEIARRLKALQVPEQEPTPAERVSQAVQESMAAVA